MHQLTTPNTRRMKLPEASPPGSCIQLIVLMVHSVTSFCQSSCRKRGLAS
jgi:hypothetical protein